MPKICAVIPTYNPSDTFESLIRLLKTQSIALDKILVINTDKNMMDPEMENFLSESGVELLHIKKSDFDHGGTRNLGAKITDGDFVLFMTQDAAPCDTFLVERLLESFENPQVGAAYARQLPWEKSSILEKYTRNFNYPPESRVKSEEDIPKYGIKTFFCSNVCAMYRMSYFKKLGGFEDHIIFNEDMVYASKLIISGYSIAYCADARVFHSHNYSGLQQFHRNFDQGVSQADHPEVFSEIKSESEGIRMVKQTASYLVKQGKTYMLIPLVWQSGCKYIGFWLGKRYKKIPMFLIRKFSLNKEYWENSSIS